MKINKDVVKNKSKYKTKKRDPDELIYDSLKELEHGIRTAEQAGFVPKLEKYNPANRARFIQIIQDNWLYLLVVKSDYLSQSEISTIIKLCTLTNKYYNLLTEYEKRSGYGYIDNKQYASISYMAEFFGESRSNFSKKVNSLINKGIIIEDRDKVEKDVNEKKFNIIPLYMNPQICYQGDRNKMYGKLSRLVIEDDILEQNGILLPWKVWIGDYDKYGKLIKRGTYLKKTA